MEWGRPNVMYLYLLVALCIFRFSKADETAQRSQFFGQSWPIPFEENSQTLPSLDVKLSPPEDPLPQVSAEIQLLERARMRLEEGIMAKLEDEYNKQLDAAQTQIQEAVDKAMRVFDDPGILKGTVKGALLPITAESKAKSASFAKQPGTGGLPGLGNVPGMGSMPGMPFFRQLNQTTSIKPINEHRISSISEDPSMLASSFLETQESTKSDSKFIGGLLGALGGGSHPSVKIELTDVKEPDEKVKSKMDEMEQKRTDEETRMFEEAVAEFDQLTKITVQELEKNIQIQMNPFLVDTQAVTSALTEELPANYGGGGAGMMPSLSGRPPSPGQVAPGFRQLQESNEFLNNKCNEILRRYPKFQLDCGRHNDANVEQASFLQVREAFKTASRAGLFGGLPKQLNVRVGQSDKPYPTVQELVSDMQKKRDATERLERMKILELQLKLLKAEDEMIKDALHSALARVMAQYGPVVASIKREVAVHELS